MSSRALIVGLGAFVGLGGIVAASYLLMRPTDPVSRLTIDTPQGHWAREGFVEMVPPVRLPSTAVDRDDVSVWLRLPDAGVIETREDSSGQVSLVFPPGTVAERVEVRGKPGARMVVDVRGTRFDDEGREWMHTYRRAARGDDPALFGFEWPRDQPEAHDEATARLLAEIAERPPVSSMKADRRERYLASIERKNECTNCHGYGRPTNQREGEHGLVNRGTDGSGLFTPQTVLSDTVVLERYGTVDPNLDDPVIEITCPDGQSPQRVTRKKRERAQCPDKQVPLGTVDLSTLEPGRLARLCRARRYLYEHLDARGQELFAAGIARCEGVTDPGEGT